MARAIRPPHKTPTMEPPEEEQEPELPQNVADLAQASVPSAIRGIRACKRCGILKTLDQFVDDGCEASSPINVEGDGQTDAWRQPFRIR